MRPHRLHMVNFGPFLNTTVDFDRLGDVVYMIVGETGAGKTMIFDGISFALFGKASGDKRKSVPLEEFYCRHVKKDDQGKRPSMVVELEFAEKGHEYRVRREIFWGKTGKAASCSVTSQLFKDGTEITDQRGDNSARPESGMVTKTVEDMIGLRADDFKKIIMLAQGEFQRFLEATGKDRNEILGRIYNNSPHIDLENRLRGAYSRLTARKKGLDEKMKEALSCITVPEGLSEEDQMRLDLYVEDENDLWDVLSKVEVLLEEECNRTKEALENQDTKVIALNQKKAQASQNNALLDQKKALEVEKEALVSKASMYEALERKKEEVASAGSILPYKDAAKKASLMLSDAKGKKERLEVKKAQCEESVTSLQKEALSLEKELLPEVEKKQKEVLHLQELAPVYEALEEHVKALDACSVLSSALEEDYGKVETKLKKVEKAKKANDEILTTYQEAGESAVHNAASLLEAANEKEQALNALLSAMEETKALEEETLACDKEYQKAEEATKKAQEEYDQANLLLRSGRAGSLAREMIKDLEEQDEVICPVCGVVHTKADIGKFSKECENIPEEKDVDALYQKLTKARNKEQKLHGSFRELQGRLDLARKSRVEDAGRFFAKDYSFEELVATDPFKEEGNRLKQEQSQAQKAYEEAVKARDAKNAALIQKKELETSYEELLKKKDQLSEKKKEEEMRLTALKRDVEHDQAQLKNSPSTKQLALQEEEAAKKAISKWQKEMDEAKKAHQAMEKSLGEVLGQLQENQQQVASFTEEEERTGKELEGKLESLGYDSLSQIEEVLTVDGRELSSMEDVTKWCGDVEKEVKAYQKKASDVESRLNENLKNTKGLSYVDLSLLLEELQGLQEEKKALDAKSKEEYSALRQTKENIRRLHEGMATLHKLHKIELELKPMVDNTMGRVYKFHDYVLSDFFKQIVEHASHYFMELMDGKYSLEAVIHENKTAKKGEEELRDLDLQAVDEKGNHSNIALLSGGQSFEASLALALGLSEVVQMQKTGKVHIESMFIDEGFGTLDGHRLDQSMMVLNSMTNQSRQIGIITHVEKLVNADTYKKLEVTHKDGLSTVKFVDNK